MILIVYYGLGIIRTFNWREFAIPIIGLITPNIYVMAYYYFNGEAEVFFNYFIEPKTFLTFLEFNWVNWLPGMIISIWALFSVFYLLTSGRKRTVRENNLYKIIGATLVMAVFLGLIFHKDFMSASGLVWPALALILTYQTLGISRRWIQEGIFYLLLMAILSRDILHAWF